MDITGLFWTVVLGIGLGVYIIFDTFRTRASKRESLKQEYDALKLQLEEIQTDLAKLLPSGDSSESLSTLLEPYNPKGDVKSKDLKEELPKIRSELALYRDVVDKALWIEEHRNTVEGQLDITSGQATEILQHSLTAVKERRQPQAKKATERLEVFQSYIRLAQYQTISEASDSEIGGLREVNFSPATDELRTALTTDTNSRVEAQLLAALVDKLVFLFAIMDWDTRVPTDEAVAAVNHALSSPTEEAIQEAEHQIDELSLLYERTERVQELLDKLDPDDNSDSYAEFQTAVSTAIETGDAEMLESYAARAENTLNQLWEYEDLFTYDWREFEHLIGDLWRDEGYKVQVTQGTTDGGIDVRARSDGEVVSIQVKQQSPSNKVGVQIIRQTASDLASGKATHAVVVTSSSFTQPAIDEAKNYTGRLTLVDGSELVRRLSNSTLVPPIGYVDTISENEQPPERDNARYLEELKDSFEDQLQEELSESKSNPVVGQNDSQTNESGEVGKKKSSPNTTGSTKPSTHSDRATKQTKNIPPKTEQEDNLHPIQDQSVSGGSESEDDGHVIMGSGERISIRLVGLGYVEPGTIGIPTGGHLIALEITNNWDHSWTVKGESEFTLVDEDSFIHNFADRIDLDDLPSNWKTYRVVVPPGTKTRFVGFVDAPPRTTFQRLQYEQSVLDGNLDYWIQQTQSDNESEYNNGSSAADKERVVIEFPRGLRGRKPLPESLIGR